MSHSDPRSGETVALLERTPATLDALLSGVPDTWARATQGEGAWSPYNVVGHVIRSRLCPPVKAATTA